MIEPIFYYTLYNYAGYVIALQMPEHIHLHNLTRFITYILDWRMKFVILSRANFVEFWLRTSLVLTNVGKYLWHEMRRDQQIRYFVLNLCRKRVELWKKTC